MQLISDYQQPPSRLDLLLQHLARRAVKRPPHKGWLIDVAAGDFSRVPRSLTWANSAEVALLIEGYELARESGSGMLQVFANDRWEQAEDQGWWSGDLLDLWLSLYAEHRRARHGGYGPEGESLRLLDALCRTFAHACAATSAKRSYLVEDWTGECANLIEHWIWEPQHLGKKTTLPKEDTLTPAELTRRVMRREVPLNHVLNIFFRLAPDGLTERWFQSLLPNTPAQSPRLRHTRGHPALSVCQPDMLFQSKPSRLFVELKLGSSASVDQLCRYAAFATSLDWHGGGRQPCGLVFLGPTRRHFRKLEPFLGGMPDGFRLSDDVIAKLRPFGFGPDDVVTTLERMEVAVATYTDLDRHLDNEADRAGKGEAAETLRRLISGVRSFLKPLVVQHEKTSAEETLA